MSSTPNDPADVLRSLRSEIRSIHHDLSNPLAIISGNLQLLQELGGMEGASSVLMESINDASEALKLFEVPLSRLEKLRDALGTS